MNRIVIHATGNARGHNRHGYGHDNLYKHDMTAVIMNILVNKDLCTGCGFCADNCPQSVFELTDGKSCVVNAEDCLECHLCEVSCESGAITIEV